MAESTKVATGHFCWIELQTTDPAAGRKFYSDLFGWTITDAPGPLAYGMAMLGDKMTAGVMQLPEQARAMGAPPSWLSYVAVDDVAAYSRKAAALGGKVLMPPAAMGPGTFAVVQDPTGAVFALWHAAEPMGTFMRGEPGSLGWNELATTNVDLAQRFYTSLFGWKAELASGPMPYTIFKSGDAGGGDSMVAGMMGMTKEMAGVPSNWGVYFSVADADAMHAKATKAGAKTLVPPTDIPNIGRFAVVQDPQGAAFSIIKFLPMAAN